MHICRKGLIYHSKVDFKLGLYLAYLIAVQLALWVYGDNHILIRLEEAFSPECIPQITKCLLEVCPGWRFEEIVHGILNSYLIKNVEYLLVIVKYNQMLKV
jgi:hypothetical protein